jgi:hypothetical protein
MGVGVAPIEGWCVDRFHQPTKSSSEHPEELESRCKEAFVSGCEQLLGWGLMKLTRIRMVRSGLQPAIADVDIARFSSPEGAWAFVSDRVLIDLDIFAESERENLQRVQGAELALVSGTSLHAIDGMAVFIAHYTDRFSPQRQLEQSAQRELPKLLRAWLEAQPSKQPLPRALSLLPSDHRKQMGRRFQYADALGIPGAGHAAIGYYKDGDRQYSVFVASYVEEAAAKDAALVLRRQPGAHSLEDVSFDAFELTRAVNDAQAPQLWLIGQHMGRVAGVGSAPPAPVQRRDDGPRRWLRRPEKMRLLRAVMSAR